MFGIENIWLFITTGLLLNLYPGPDTMYIIGRSVSQGKLAGACAVLGISSGAIVHTIAGSIGLSALILTSAKAFTILQYLGALYLLYQAITMLRASNHVQLHGENIIGSTSLIKIYKQGAITNILNPKVGLFFMALIPQFISSSCSNKPLAYLMLSTIIITIGTIWCLLVSLLSSYLSSRLRNNSLTSKWLLRVNASVFAYLGYRLAISEINMLNG